MASRLKYIRCGLDRETGVVQWPARFAIDARLLLLLYIFGDFSLCDRHSCLS